MNCAANRVFFHRSACLPILPLSIIPKRETSSAVPTRLPAGMID